MNESPRIDKWLWSVRVFKTRSLATEACRKGHVLINGLPVKPSHNIKTGDIIRVRKPPIYRSYQVIAPAVTRVGAKEVNSFMTEVTPPEELALLQNQKDMQWNTRERGSGRPTKKERRNLDDFFNRI
jgi:ribosome-associated heat shock protein Hsp15